MKLLERGSSHCDQRQSLDNELRPGGWDTERHMQKEKAEIQRVWGIAPNGLHEPKHEEAAEAVLEALEVKEECVKSEEEAEQVEDVLSEIEEEYDDSYASESFEMFSDGDISI